MTAVSPRTAPPCSDNPDMWFADDPAHIAVARSFCGECRLQDVCLDGAIERQEAFGIFGGLDVGERNEVARLRGVPLAGEWAHGSPAGYKAHGCRCDLCRAAHARDVREWNQRRRLIAPATSGRTLFVVLDRPSGSGRFRAYPGQLLLPIEGVMA